MNQVDTNAVLNRLAVVHNRSLATYLTYAAPWATNTDVEAMKTLKDIAEQHQETTDRLGALIMENKGTVETGAFPMRYTAWHDVSLAFLLVKLVESQEATIATIQECVEQLRFAPMFQAVSEELLGAAKAHLDALHELGASAQA